MVELMEVQERYFVSTEEKAEDLVQSIKEANIGNVKRSSIDKKTKKECEYYIVVVVLTHAVEKELFETM